MDFTENGGIIRFNLRVYALILKQDKVLLVDENINDFNMTKFPGGGVEPGEGIIVALKRELNEEMQISLLSYKHFYTTEFFQESAFNSEDQIVSIYYLVDINNEWDTYASDQSLTNKKHLLRFYYKPIKDVKLEAFTFPIDRHVMGMLKQQFNADFRK